MKGLIWFNAKDLKIFDKSIFLQKYISGEGTIPLINVKWLVKNGDYVKNGDIIFIAYINIDGYQHNKYSVEYDKEITNYGEVLVKSAENGIFFSKNNQNYFECNAKRPIFAICDNMDSYVNTSQNSLFIIKENDYVDYNLYRTSHRHSKEFSEKETKIYIHNSLKSAHVDDLTITWSLKSPIIESISNWILNENGLTYGSYGKNELNKNYPSFFINEDLSIDCLTDLLYCDNIPPFINFRKVNGDFHTYANTGTIKGCPRYVNGNFECIHWKSAKKEALKSFEFMPLYIEGDCIVKHHNISSFEGMPSYIGGVFNISDNNFDDESWDYAKEHIEAEFGDYKISNNKFVKYRKELF